MLTFGLGSLAAVFHRARPADVPPLRNSALQNQSGGHDRADAFDIHDRLSAAAKRYGDGAGLKSETKLVASVAHAQRLIDVLLQTKAVDLGKLVRAQTAGERKFDHENHIAINLGRGALKEDVLRSDLYLYVDDTGRTNDAHFQDGNPVVLGVRTRRSETFRQLHLSECELVDPDKLRAVLSILAVKMAQSQRIPEVVWEY